MGYDLATVENLPRHLNCYFFLIGDYSNRTPINDFFSHELNAIANRLGEKAAIIRQTRNSRIERELCEAIRQHHFDPIKITKFFDAIECQYPGLLILKDHPYNLTENSMVLYVPLMALHEVYTNTEELLTDLTKFTRGDPQLLDKIKRWTEKPDPIDPKVSIGVNILFFTINYEF